MVTVISLIKLVFTSRGIKKDDIAKKLQEFVLKPLVLGENEPKS